MILLIAALCCAALSYNVMAQGNATENVTERQLTNATEPQLTNVTEPQLTNVTEPQLTNVTEPQLTNVTEPQLTVLKQDTAENLSAANLTLYTAVDDFGPVDALMVGEAVKFTAPRPDWQLRAVQILGWNGFNGSVQSIPVESNFLLEIRDQNSDLLYRMSDTQNAYFTTSSLVFKEIEIPPINITGDFYVVFYDRGSMWIGLEQENATGNSFFFNSSNKVLDLAQWTYGENNQTFKANWVIRAAGE